MPHGRNLQKLISRIRNQPIGLWILFPLILTTACVLHPATGTEPSRELFGLNDSSQEDALLLSGLIMGLDAAPATPRITLYDAGMMDGGMGGIQNANVFCQNSPNKPPGTMSKAFLSTSDQDLISLPGVPADLAVRGPNNLLIADSWSDLFGTGESIENSMYDAGVLPFPSMTFYSGTDVNGQSSTLNTCLDWNSPSLQDTGAVGIANLTAENWINGGAPMECAYSHSILCAAW